MPNVQVTVLTEFMQEVQELGLGFLFQVVNANLSLLLIPRRLHAIIHRLIKLCRGLMFVLATIRPPCVPTASVEPRILEEGQEFPMFPFDEDQRVPGVRIPETLVLVRVAMHEVMGHRCQRVGVFRRLQIVYEVFPAHDL